jgi:hypothetical protein
MVSVNLAGVLSTASGASLSTSNRRDVGAGVDVKVKF